MYTLGSAVHITVELWICTAYSKEMYRNNARDAFDIASACRLISERVTKALHFRKVLKNESFEVSRKWALG